MQQINSDIVIISKDIISKVVISKVVIIKVIIGIVVVYKDFTSNNFTYNINICDIPQIVFNLKSFLSKIGYKLCYYKECHLY
jgi:hypothetical protein